MLLVELQERNGSWPQGSSQEKLNEFHTDTFETAFSILALSESHASKKVLSIATEEASTTEQASVK
ncbi:MAG: hypothetical protein R3A13_10375 [Bdellovibrionota bacterium]